MATTQKLVTFDNVFEKEKNVRLEDHFKLHHLEQLLHEFQIHQPDDILIQEGTGYFPPKMEKRQPGLMNLEEFKETVDKVLGTDEYEEYLEKLFTKLDTSCDGYVDWNDFSTYMLLLYRENDYMQTKREIPFLVEPRIRHIVQNRQEQTTKIVAVENPTRYVTISKEGAISVWQTSMQFEKSYVISDEDDDQSGQKRRFHMWVTDAIYMSNCNKIAIGSTSRDIRFYDCSTSQYFEEFHLFAMPDVPYCFDYWYDVKKRNSESLLLFGVDTGALHLLYFKQPVTQLFQTPFKSDGGVQKIFMQDLNQHSRWVRYSVILDVHPDLIRQVRYMPENDAIISSSECSQKSVVISDIQKLRRTYIFKIDKGVECFDHSKNLNILVTGSSDHILRIWNPYVTSKPVAILHGHATGVIGAKIHEGLMQVFTYSGDAVIKVWDIKEHSCLQTIVLKFPSSIHGRMPEHGQFPIHLQPNPHSALLVTCNDYIGMLKLGQTEVVKSTIATTHDTQLCCALYNPYFKQVVTGCDSSSIAVWDIDKGTKSIVFSNAHGDEEITAMVFDETWRRLITGARNGSIKVWNFQNGHNLHKLEAVDEAEVTGIMPLNDQKVILAVGWSRLITQYDDSDPDNTFIPANNDWKGKQLHKDDILSLDYCPPNLFATAGFDGEIIVWDVETEKIFLRLRKGQATNISKKIEALQAHSDASRPTSRNSRPNSRHRKTHRVAKGQAAPVDKLLFLRGRASVKFTESAVLISSEAGILRWWSLYGVKKEVGYFYAAESTDESVLAMCTKPNNSILITGDTQGYIKVWYISDYCTKSMERRVKSKPPLENGWRAHDSAVVSVEYIEHETGAYILSASTDRTSRLWNLEGHFIGTFGQKYSWNLKIPSTWAHPHTPWTVEGVKPKEGEKDKKDEKEEVEENGVTEENGEWIGDIEEGAPENDTNEDQSDSLIKQLAGDTDRKRGRVQADPVNASRLKYTGRSQTFAFGTNRFERSKTFLGVKVEKELARKKLDRKGRREHFGEIDTKKTQRFGKICSPFHALTTPEVREVDLPQNLPLSQRMLDKGYSSKNLTEEGLKNMDFSYGGPDYGAPPVIEEETSQDLPKEDVSIATKSGKNSKDQTPVSILKKQHTVA